MAKGWKHTPENRKYLGELLTKAGEKTRFKKGEHRSSGTEFKKGCSRRLGLKHSEESKNKMSLSLIGRSAPKTAFTSERMCGTNNVNWKGGVTPINEKIRKSKIYKEWRFSVMKRDDFTCMVCKFQGYVNAHHIKRFEDFKELRFDVNNGITLCPQCHRITLRREYLFETYFQGILEKGFNSAELSQETTPSQQERLRKALWACVEVRDE